LVGHRRPKSSAKCLENTAIDRHIYSSLFNSDLACLFRMFFDQNRFFG
jgi:hypothetical protein